MKLDARSVLVGLALALVVAVGAGCGSDDKSSSSKATGNAVDRAFVQQMVPHHRSGIEMAAIARTEATGSFVKKIAADISSAQTREIAQLRRVDGPLAAAGIEVGDLGITHEQMGMMMDAKELHGAKPFDDKFIAMMVPHHEGAIAMARVELAKGENAELKKLAQSIISTQQAEVKMMRDHKGSASRMGKMHKGSSTKKGSSTHKSSSSTKSGSAHRKSSRHESGSMGSDDSMAKTTR